MAGIDVNRDKVKTCLRGGTISSQKSLSVLHAGTRSLKQFRLHQWTSCSDECGLARADLVLSQTPFPHLGGKKNSQRQIPWFLLEVIYGSEQKCLHSSKARNKLWSLFCLSVVLVYLHLYWPIVNTTHKDHLKMVAERVWFTWYNLNVNLTLKNAFIRS